MIVGDAMEWMRLRASRSTSHPRWSLLESSGFCYLDVLAYGHRRASCPARGWRSCGSFGLLWDDRRVAFGAPRLVRMLCYVAECFLKCRSHQAQDCCERVDRTRNREIRDSNQRVIKWQMKTTSTKGTTHGRILCGCLCLGGISWLALLGRRSLGQAQRLTFRGVGCNAICARKK